MDRLSYVSDRTRPLHFRHAVIQPGNGSGLLLQYGGARSYDAAATVVLIILYKMLLGK
jgi:hypothetical protein